MKRCSYLSTNAELENIKANTSSNESFCDHPHEVASLVLAQACAIVIVFAERIRSQFILYHFLMRSSVPQDCCYLNNRELWGS